MNNEKTEEVEEKVEEEAEEEAEETVEETPHDTTEKKPQRTYFKPHQYAPKTQTKTQTHTPSLSHSHTPPPTPSPSLSQPQMQPQITLQELENAIQTINRFASYYRRAVAALENLERAERFASSRLQSTGGLKSVFGIPLSSSYSDPITAMLMGAMEQAVQEQARKIVEKRAKSLGLSAEGEKSEEMEEALSALDSASEGKSESGREEGGD